MVSCIVFAFFTPNIKYANYMLKSETQTYSCQSIPITDQTYVDMCILEESRYMNLGEARGEA